MGGGDRMGVYEGDDGGMTRKLVALVQTPLDPGARDHCCGSGGNKSGLITLLTNQRLHH